MRLATNFAVSHERDQGYFACGGVSVYEAPDGLHVSYDPSAVSLSGFEHVGGVYPADIAIAKGQSVTVNALGDRRIVYFQPPVNADDRPQLVTSMILTFDE